MIHDNKQSMKISLATYPLKMSEQTTERSMLLRSIKALKYTDDKKGTELSGLSTLK